MVKKNNKASCPCASTKSKKVGKNNIIEKMDNIDKSIKKMLGKSKLVIGKKKYKLKKYRWFIVICLLLLLIVMVAAFRCETPVPTPISAPIVVSTIPAPIPSVPVSK